MLHIKKNQNINLIKYLVILTNLLKSGFYQGGFALLSKEDSAYLVRDGIAREGGKMVPDLTSSV